MQREPSIRRLLIAAHVRAVFPLRDDTLQIVLTRRTKQIGPASVDVIRVEHAPALRADQFTQRNFAFDQRKCAHVGAVQFKQIEGVEVDGFAPPQQIVEPAVWRARPGLPPPRPERM